MAIILTNSFIRKKIPLGKSGDALAKTAQGGGGITIRGGVQETARCGTQGCVLVEKYWW